MSVRAPRILQAVSKVTHFDAPHYQEISMSADGLVRPAMIAILDLYLSDNLNAYVGLQWLRGVYRIVYRSVDNVKECYKTQQ